MNIFDVIPQNIDSPPAESSEVEVPHHWVR